MKQRDLLKKKNVVLVARGKKIVDGVTTDRDAIIVGVTKKVTPRTKAAAQLGLDNLVPQSIDGVETDVIEVGEIRALAVDRTKKWRPAPGGCSIGHFAITAGTLGMVVKKGGIAHILSNNHVLANSNDAEIYDPVLQPGPHDGGTSADIIGNLTAFVKINFTGDPSTCLITRLAAWCFNGLAKLFHRYSRLGTYSTETNKVDCAIARPIIEEDISDEILEIGKPAGFNLAELQVGQAVKKSGRTTGLNQGSIVGLDAIVSVGYGDNKMALFVDQVLTTPIAQGGDSGSVVLNENNQVIGLLFAGSDAIAIVNKIANVIEGLGLDNG
jgi:hypothetical protein